jgi:hypothetical protein
MSMTDYINERYDVAFESVHYSLVEMVKNDPVRAEHHIRGILRGLYVRQGNDWTGRGAIGNAGLDASIAAYECILAELTTKPTKTPLEPNPDKPEPNKKNQRPFHADRI